MTTFSIEYRREDYTLADCMRPDPKWGKKGFTVRSEDLGTEDINEVMKAAKHRDSVPKGYKLFAVWNVQTGEKVIA